MKILFSCMGTSDPVRGYRDGPLLHILRHYRPDKVVVLLSDEAGDLDRKGNRLAAVGAFMQEYWDGYVPEITVLRTELTDPSDMDAVGKPITREVGSLCRAYPDADVLLNLSSGTPQMKQVLAMLAADMRYQHLIGVQVKSPEKAAGTTDRTNKPDYSVGDELECNEDELPDAENRCSEPAMLLLRRQQTREQILTLLDQRDYAAVYALKNSMPEELKALVGHLEARDRLQDDIARNRAQNVRLPFSLYPAHPSRSRSDYGEVSEVYLVLLNRQHRRQFEEMVLRLNPLIVRLQLTLLKNLLWERGLRLEEVIWKPYSLRPHFYPQMLLEKLPEVYRKVCEAYGGTIRESDVSISLCNKILSALPDVPPKALETLLKCEKMNESCRNELAHQLTAVTAEQLKEACGMEPAQLLREVGDLIASLYPECDKTLFTVYKRCGDYIRESLMN